jgi:hypothetical protein
MANVITSEDYRAVRRTMLHAMQYLRNSYSCFDSDSCDAYNLAVAALLAAYKAK